MDIWSALCVNTTRNLTEVLNVWNNDKQRGKPNQNWSNTALLLQIFFNRVARNQLELRAKSKLYSRAGVERHVELYIISCMHKAFTPWCYILSSWSMFLSETAEAGGFCSWHLGFYCVFTIEDLMSSSMYEPGKPAKDLQGDRCWQCFFHSDFLPFWERGVCQINMTLIDFV